MNPRISTFHVEYTVSGVGQTMRDIPEPFRHKCMYPAFCSLFIGRCPPTVGDHLFLLRFVFSGIMDVTDKHCFSQTYNREKIDTKIASFFQILFNTRIPKRKPTGMPSGGKAHIVARIRTKNIYLFYTCCDPSAFVIVWRD